MPPVRGGIQFSFEWEHGRGYWVEQFLELGFSFRSLHDPLETSVREVIAPSIRKNFEVGGRPPWEPRSESTLAHSNTGVNILVQTGRLRDAASALARWSFTTEDAAFTGLPDFVAYGNVHQEGGGLANATPARPFLMFQEEDLNGIEEVFGEWITYRLLKAGFR